MSIASADVRADVSRRPLLDRALSAAPLLASAALTAVLYATQAAAHPTPILFTDELQWAQLSRAVAEGGLPSIRGERTDFDSLYVFLIAPAWWLKDTATAYEAIKYLNVVLMISAAFPTYLLARRLVSKPAAVAVAVASVSIPPMVYALYVLTEPLAYPWAALCVWLMVEALARRTRGWIAAAVATALVAPLVRGQLVLIPAVFAVAALFVWWVSPRARRLRGPAWRAGDTIALALVAVGVFAVGARVFLHSNTVWRLATDPEPSQVLSHALSAVGALTIGLGVLPLVAGLTALVPRRDERLSAYDAPFVAVTATALALFPFYTGVKGAYNLLTFADRVDERNVFYVAPLLLVGTAIALERRRVRLVPLAAAAAVAAYLIVSTPIHLEYPYFDAPGFSIATMTNRDFAWPLETIERALLVTLVVSVALVLAARFARGPAARTGLAAVALLVVAWNLTGQITAAGGANATSRSYLGRMTQPPDWVDRATGGGTAAYLGQTITTGVGLRTNLLEFWNRSIVRVGTTDGALLFPGPTFHPRVVDARGTLSHPPGTDYVLADAGVVPVGSAIAGHGTLRLYSLDGAIRLRESSDGVDEETWMGAFGAYNRFAGAGRGEVVVTLSRTAFCPDPNVAPRAPRATVTVGRLTTVLRDGLPHPGLGQRWATGTRVVPNCEHRELRLPVGPAPWRAEVTVDRTFKPADYGFPDTRILGVMVGFRFEPGRGGGAAGNG